MRGHQTLSDVYRRYYDCIAANPGLTLSDLAKLQGARMISAENILAWMEYYGYLLSENEGRLYPYRIVRHYPQDLHNDPVSRNTRWKRTGSTCAMT